MRITNCIIPLFIFIIVGCAPNNIQQNQVITTKEASWPYEFVIVDGESYQLTREEVDEIEVGELLGMVKRNIVDMDTDSSLAEKDFDSNFLKAGTEIYTHNGSNNSILYKSKHTYFKALLASNN
ncbi:hypothetical protein [Sutcliffiella rhizosphaerae]|uniref:Uncharacterized protein n=1 Tax=Sutcliffiella rhizosphaerae TaxID=2880967 RepID=A0ABM8YKQ4_9BACI|nr:hypothetical protein [Sutcliffiella rhizosphaerae]CAG9620444.1 hypothetical protein BACCIP111883_01212 [Sutcliffiella rhizosphaerae]